MLLKPSPVALSLNTELQAFSANILFAVYMYSYIVLVCLTVFFFSALYEKSCVSFSFKVILSAVIRYRLRWLLLLMFTSMAALPPSFFFFSKLSLLSSVMLFGAWHATVLFLGYIFFSWSVYYGVLRYFLFSLRVTSVGTLHKQRLSAKNATAAAVVFCFLLFAAFLFDDVFFFLCWALV